LKARRKVPPKERSQVLGFLPRGAVHPHRRLDERLDDHFERE